MEMFFVNQSQFIIVRNIFAVVKNYLLIVKTIEFFVLEEFWSLNEAIHTLSYSGKSQ